MTPFECSLQEMERFFKEPGWKDVAGRILDSIEAAKEELAADAMSGTYSEGKVGRIGGAIEAFRNVLAFEVTLPEEKRRRLQEAEDKQSEEDNNG